MNRLIAFDIYAIIILIVLILSMIARKMIVGKTNLVFLATIISILLCTIADFISVLAPYAFSYTKVNYIFVYIMHFLYFFLRYTTPLLYSIFIFVLCGKSYILNNKRIRFRLFALELITFLIPFVNIFYPFLFSLSKEFEYVRGPFCWIGYFWGCSLMIVGGIYAVVNRKLLKPLYFFMVILQYPLIALGVILQYFMPWIEIEMFTTTILMMSLSMIVLQPKNILDYSSGAFNSVAFEDVLRQNLLSKRRMHLIYFKILNSKSLRFQYGTETFQKFLREIIKKIYSFHTIMDCDIYNIENGIFVVVTQNENQDILQNYLNELENFLSLHHTIAGSPFEFDHLISVCRCPQDFNTYEQVYNYALRFDSIIKKKNQITYFNQEAKNHFFIIENNMDDIIKKAILGQKFQMVYQPIYSVKEQAFTSAEALIRLVDDKYGLIMPGAFIPSAENSGAIHQIGDIILDSVCKFISEFDFINLGLKYIEINLSVAQCIEPELPQKIYNALKLYNIPPERINLELTETSNEEDPGVSDKNIKELSRIGIKLSLDDFGTGYSNLMRLTNLPMDIIKLDKVFVDEINKPGMDIIVNNLVSMLKKLNKKVLIEGVETREQLDKFVDLGVDYVQGYYYSKPLAERDFIRFISRNNS